MNRNREVRDPSFAFIKSKFVQNCFMFLLFSLCPLLIYQPAFQNDTYWLINTGKYILRSGFPGVEPFTIHEGLHFIAQQWLSSVIFFAGYRLTGSAGVHVLVIFTCAVTLFLIYRLALHLAEGNMLIASYVTAFIGISLSSYMVPRPQVFSLFVFVAAVFLLEYYVSNQIRRGVVILLLVLLSVLLINLHAAMWPVLFLLYIPYLVDGFKFKIGEIEGQGFDAKPIWAAFLLSVFAGAANPYGHRAMTYLFSSYGDSVISSQVQEMFSPDFKSVSGLFIFAVVSAVVFIYFLVEGRTRLRYVLLTTGTLYMGLSSVRSFSLFIVFGIVFLSRYLKDVNLSASMPARRRTILVATAILAMVFVRISRIQKADLLEESFKPEAAVHFIKSNIDVSKMRLYNSYDTGGYIEFSGIKAFIDSRAEIFTKRVNQKKDIIRDYRDAMAGNLYYSDLIAEYSLTHLLLNKEEPMNNCLKRDRGFKIVFEDKNYVLYQKIAL